MNRWSGEGSIRWCISGDACEKSGDLSVDRLRTSYVVQAAALETRFMKQTMGLSTLYLNPIRSQAAKEACSNRAGLSGELYQSFK
jgi:hypothetical protein